MLDAGCRIPDIEDYFNTEIEKHPAASIQDQLILARGYVAAT
jgi:hypothetical protein